MPPPAPIKVLYVDDEEANRRAFTWIFRSEGFEVEEAATGREALRLVEGKPDVVILDVNLPDIDGFEVCRRIKAHPSTASIPVLHVSALYVKSADKRQGLEAGADCYLVKPVEPAELLAHTKALVRVHRAEEERTRLLRERAQLAHHLHLLLESTGEGIFGIDRDGTATFLNRAGAEMFGYVAADFIGRNSHVLIHHSRADGSPYPREECPIYLAVQDGQGCRVDREVLWRRDGTSFPAEYSAYPIREGSSIRGAVVTVVDITERRRLEEQLLRAQKLEAVAHLAGGVAHDFNNLLTVVLGNLSLAQSSLAASDPSQELLRAAEQASQRSALLVRQLLGFSRQTRLRPQPVSLPQVVEEVVGLLRRTIDPRITLEIAFAADLWPVWADPGQMNQVLMNLCLNARDAMPGGGRLVVQADNVVLDEEFSRRHLEARAGEFVRLRVEDTGHGIAPELRPHIFEPFFTTKEPGKGTGLGLAMVFGIVKQHQGWIECDSAVNRGTRFDLYLPRSPEAAAPSPVPAAPPAAGGQETLLLADDEPMLRALGRAILEGRGYQVLLAEDGRQAVEVYERERARIHLVILDLTMPRLSGRDALRELLRLNPRLPVLLASGYGAEGEAETIQEGVVGFIDKPYRPDDLANAVRRLLDQARAAPEAVGPPGD